MGAREPTEAPTPRRLAEARRRGKVAVSRDLVSAGATAAALGTVLVTAGAATGGLVAGFRDGLSTAAGGRATAASAIAAGLSTLVHALLPPLVAGLVAALVIGLWQTRGLVAARAVAPQLSRLSPGEGLRRLLSAGAAFEVGKGLVKAGLVAGLLGWLLAPHLAGVIGLAGAPAGAVLAAFGVLAQRLVIAVGLAALVLGTADLLVTRRRHRRRLRMTPEEVRREHKETEGDPLHRAERLRLQRELFEQRMIADVRKADFVVVNPDHIAVALRYDRDRDAAPVVLASGERLLAEQIKRVAREAGVPIFQDVTLARSLRAVSEGDEIPPALYEAVAEVIRVLQGVPDRPPLGPSTPNGPVAAVRDGTGWKRA
ncbi:MAG TPA: EscU/YscU/HrcU family type III secretion system export apparatus switch protein [Polyangia bacterium]|nr:EscU/YscU/HrcU family type III secretion system export apparatus switch protein [Polyangia bacterium]